MQCSCGGETESRVVIRQKAPVARYERCKACGRICWRHFAPGWSADRLFPYKTRSDFSETKETNTLNSEVNHEVHRQ